MSGSMWLYFCGMALLFCGQRLLSGIDELTVPVSAVGVLTVLAAGALRLRAYVRVPRSFGTSSEDGGHGVRFGHRIALICYLISLASLVMYAGTTTQIVSHLHLDVQAETRWLGIWSSLWPLIWLLGSVPMALVDYALVSSPVMMPLRRVRDLVGHGAVVALGLALVFPLNYIATKQNISWDLAYFKTPKPGTATLAIAESLEQPITVRIFMPASSEVAQELRTYFEALSGPRVQVQIVDQAAQPRLARALGVVDNGEIAFTQGEVLLDPPATPEADTPGPTTRRLRVPIESDKARRILKKLDVEVQTVLRELGHGERIAYITTGHGELAWEGTPGRDLSDRKMTVLKQGLKQFGFRVKPLGAVQGLGERVPSDADVVLILGAVKQFQRSEVEALTAYLDAGGSLLIALEPAIAREEKVAEDPLDELLGHLGVKLGDGALAGEQGIQPLYHNKLDRLLLVTDGFTDHPSTTTVAQRGGRNVLFTPVSGFIEEVPGQPNKVTFTVRSLASAWADLNKDLEFSPDAGETKEARSLVAAIEGGHDGASWRGIVTADSSIFSDLGISNLGNQRFVSDGLNWLVGAEALAGTTESEEDIKIEHTKEGQTSWFYLTVLGAPFAVMLLGVMRMRLRKRSGRRS